MILSKLLLSPSNIILNSSLKTLATTSKLKTNRSLGRSVSPGSLLLWTHNVKGITFSNSFVPATCSTAGVNAVTVAAGEQWSAVYAAANAQGVNVVGGVTPSVGAAGGWIMGAGHGGLAPTYGLGIDSTLYYNKKMFWNIV